MHVLSATVLIASIGLGWFGLNHAIRRSLEAPRQASTRTPTGLSWFSVRIPTCRNKRLHGWHIPGATPDTPCVVILHGWGGNAEAMLPLASPLHAAGYALLFIEARNHGSSDPDDFSSLPRFAEDLEHAIDWLRTKPAGNQLQIAVIGHSVGAGAALLAGSHRKDIRALVSISAFAHPERMMRRWLKSRHIPYWPLGAYILHYVQHVIGHRFDDIAPCHVIRRQTCPVLLIHGRDDPTVPPDDATCIFANGNGIPVELLLIPGSHEHFDLDEENIAPLLAFLHTHLPPSPHVASGRSGQAN